MSQAERHDANVRRMVKCMHQAVDMVEFAMRQGIPEHEPAARAQLQTWLKEQLPGTERLEVFYGAVRGLNAILPNVIMVIQLEAQQRLEELERGPNH